MYRRLIAKTVRTASEHFPCYSPIVWAVPQNSRQLAITFDDGPTDWTVRVLECLAAHQVRATFFVLMSQVVRQPDLLGLMRAGGHEIGIHGWEHSSLNYYKQVQRCLRELAGYGLATHFVRPPGGVMHFGSGMRLWLQGYVNVLWSFDTHDSMRLEGKWGAAPDYGSLSGGDIVLMHDDNELCLQEIPALLKCVNSKGLTPVTVSELLHV